jgi:Secretion system C-terminal sorting domain
MIKLKSFVFAFIVPLFFLSNSSLFAQCNPAFNQGSSVTVNYCATGGTCNSTTLSISWNTTYCGSLPDPTWSLISDGFNSSASGLEFVGSPVVTTAGTTKTSTYAVRAKTNNFMKGRVTATFQGLCGVGAEIVRSIDVFKTFSASDLDARTAVLEPGQSTFYIAGPGCVSAGERVALAVRDYITNPLGDGIGQDNYYWSYNSVSGGAVFQTLIPSSGVISPTGSNALIVKAPTPMPGQIQVVVRLGQSNSGSHAARYINRKPLEPYGLTASATGITMSNYDQGGTAQTGGACMALNATTSTAGTVTITIPTARYETGQTYRFTSPSGFSPSVIEGAQQTATFTVNNATPGAGTFTVSAVSTTCGSSSAFYNINRILNTSVNSVSISPLPTNNCLTPGSDYEFKLLNAPTGHSYTWTVNGTTPATAGWTVISPGSNGSSITLRPPTGGAQAVVAVSPVLFNPPSTACNSTISTSTLTIRGDNGFVPFITQSGARTFYTQVAPSSGTDLNFPDCDASNFYYEWRFRGNYNSTNFPTAANPNCSTWYLPPTTVNTSGPFTAPFSTTQISQSVILRAGNYGVHSSTTCSGETTARLQVFITSSPITPCTSAIGGCYAGTSILFNIPSVLSSPPGGGNDPQTFSISDLQELNRMEIVPNPAHKEVEIRLAKVNGNGTVRLLNQQGKVVKELHGVNMNQKIRLSGLPSGMYSVEFVDDQDTLFGKLLIE